MKRAFKILSVIFALMTLIGIVTVSALANSEEAESAPPDGYYFQVYDIALRQTTKYKDPEKFDSVIEGIKKTDFSALQNKEAAPTSLARAASSVFSGKTRRPETQGSGRRQPAQGYTGAGGPAQYAARRA